MKFGFFSLGSLRSKIFYSTVGITTLVIFVAIALVDYRFTREITNNIDSALAYTVRVLETFRDTHIRTLMDKGVNLSFETRLKGGVATRDPQTIYEILKEINVTLRADLLWVLDTEGKSLARLGHPGEFGESYTYKPAVKDALHLFDSADFWTLDGHLYEVAAVPMMTGNKLDGILVLGNQISHDYQEAFQPLNPGHLAIVENGRVVASSVDSILYEELTQVVRDLLRHPILSGETDSTFHVLKFHLRNERCKGVLIPIKRVDGVEIGDFLLFTSLDKALIVLRKTRWLLLAIGIGALGLSLSISFFISRGMARPVESLVNNARILGTGDLSQPVEVEATDEIGILARAFEEMRISLKKAQEEIIKSERLSVLGRMASTIIHDLKQPISIISGYAQLLKMGGLPSEKYRDYSRMIEEAIHRILGMINEVLEFSRGEYKLNRKVVALNAFIQETVEPLHVVLKNSKIQLELVLDQDAQVFLDPERMKRVLDNLARNAQEVMPEGGTISIRSAVENGSVVISIVDTGSGIPHEIQDTLFEPFVSHGKSHGTGLGLAICKRIVEEHEGSLGFTSEEGKGTTFYIRLPKA